MRSLAGNWREICVREKIRDILSCRFITLGRFEMLSDLCARECAGKFSSLKHFNEISGIARYDNKTVKIIKNMWMYAITAIKRRSFKEYNIRVVRERGRPKSFGGQDNKLRPHLFH